MTVGVHVERIRVALPADAARRAGAVALAHCGRARDTLLLIVGCDKQPGMGVAPWTIDGTLDAADALGLRTRCHRLGHAAPRDVVDRRLLRRGVTPPDHGGSFALRVPGAPHPLAIPQGWVGAHACMLVPCVRGVPTIRPARPRADPIVHGPTATALAALANHCSTQPLGDPTGAGAWLARHLFASASVVVDATWGATVGDDGPHLVAAERLFATPTLDAAVVDAAVAQHMPSHRVRPRAALAKRNLAGLGQRPASTKSLRVPGPLARAWHAYPDHRAESSR